MQVKRFLWAAAVPLLLTGCDKKGEDSDCSREKFEPMVKAIVEDMLKNEPEKFVQAIDHAMANQQRKALQEAEQKAGEMQSRFWSSNLVIGNRDAKLKMAVFFDPMDPTSQKFRAEVMEPLAKERSDVGFFLIPVCIYSSESGKGPSSMEATKAIILAANQKPEAALKLLAKFPTIEVEMSESQLYKWAEEAGLDADRLKQDMKSEQAKNDVIANGQLAVTIGIPVQLPFVFVCKSDGKLEHLPPFVKEKMIQALDAIRDGKDWRLVILPPKDGAASDSSTAKKN